MKNKIKGFTLIEIIVAIAVIGVLSAILVPSIIGHVGKSKLASANANAKLAYETAAAYCVDTRTAGYPAFDDVNCVSLKWDSDTRPTYLLNGEDMRNALKANMGENSASAGYVSIILNLNSSPAESFWAKTPDDQYVGHYPDQAEEKGEYSIVLDQNQSGDQSNG